MGWIQMYDYDGHQESLLYWGKGLVLGYVKINKMSVYLEMKKKKKKNYFRDTYLGDLISLLEREDELRGVETTSLVVEEREAPTKLLTRSSIACRSV